MTFTLSSATPADVPGILDVWIAANSDSQSMQTFVNMLGFREYITECYTHSIEENQDGVMVMTEESEKGQRRVGAFAKMSLEKGGQPPTDWRDRWKAELPESMSTESMEAFWKPLARQRLVVMGERPHLCKNSSFSSFIKGDLS
jgi:GNAT superfamily N-acetyltransferase